MPALSSVHEPHEKVRANWIAVSFAISFLGFIVFSVLYFGTDFATLHAAPTLLGRIDQVRRPVLEYFAAMLCATCAVSIPIFRYLQKRIASPEEHCGNLRLFTTKAQSFRWMLVFFFFIGMSLWLGDSLEGFLFPSLKGALQIAGDLVMLAFWIFGPPFGTAKTYTKIPYISFGSGEAKRPLVVLTPILIAGVLVAAAMVLFTIHFTAQMLIPSFALALTGLCSVPIFTGCLIFWLLIGVRQTGDRNA